MKKILYAILCFLIVKPQTGFASIVKEHATEAKESGSPEATNGPAGNCSGCHVC